MPLFPLLEIAKDRSRFFVKKKLSNVSSSFYIRRFFSQPAAFFISRLFLRSQSTVYTERGRENLGATIVFIQAENYSNLKTVGRLVVHTGKSNTYCNTSWAIFTLSDHYGFSRRDKSEEQHQKTLLFSRRRVTPWSKKKRGGKDKRGGLRNFFPRD